MLPNSEISQNEVEMKALKEEEMAPHLKHPYSNSTIRDKLLCTLQIFRTLVCHAPIAVSVANHGFLFGGPMFLCGQLPLIESPNDSGGGPQNCPLHIVVPPEGHPKSLAVYLGSAAGHAKKINSSGRKAFLAKKYAQTC